MSYSISPQHVIALVKRLSFPRVVGSAEENRGFEIIRQELTNIGIQPKFERFSSDWLMFDEAYVETNTKHIPIQPLINPLFNGPWLPIPRTVSITGVLTDDVTKRSHSEPQILIRGSIDAMKPIIPRTSAQLFICSPDEGFVGYYGRAISATGQSLPSAYVDVNSAHILLESIGLTCRFFWSTENCEKTLKNMVAEIKGTMTPNEVIAVGAHIDTFPGSPGANDNASGCARLVEFARWFMKHPPLRTLRFIWFTGEELDRRGSYEYVREHMKDESNICLFVNIDGSVSIEHEWPDIADDDVDTVTKIANDCLNSISLPKRSPLFREPVKLSSWSMKLSSDSDANPFQQAGIPVTHGPKISKRKRATSSYSHLPTDTVSTLDPGAIRVISMVQLACIDIAQKQWQLFHSLKHNSDC